MKDITIKIDYQVFSAATRFAQRNHSTVDTLVNDYLLSIASLEDTTIKAKQKLKALSEQSTAKMGKKDWTRSDLSENCYK